MRRAIRCAAQLASECFDPQGPVVELGSYYQPGYAWLSDLRPLFPGREYIGCDIRPGPGVDRIEDVERLSFTSGSVGTVILCEILEHLPHPDRALAEVRRVLRLDGLLVVSAPFHYRLHGFPNDYWRFTSAGLHVLLEDFGGRLVCAVGPRLKPAFVFALATPAATGAFHDASGRFAALLEASYQRRRRRGLASVLKERARDLLGVLLGRGELGVRFFDPQQAGGYQRDRPV